MIQVARPFLQVYGENLFPKVDFEKHYRGGEPLYHYIDVIIAPSRLKSAA